MDRQVGSRGRDALWSAVATRLALLDAASRRIQEDQARASAWTVEPPGETGKILGKPWENDGKWRFSWENHGKMMGK